MMQPEQRLGFLLRLADNPLVLGQRLSGWCGSGPILEEDIALANVALDLFGQARSWLGYAAEVEGRGRDADALAFLRDGRDFRNLLLVEQENGDYGDTMARQFLFDAWHELVLTRLTSSTDSRVAEIAAKAVKEVTFHAERSAGWVIRLGDGTTESHQRIQRSFDRLWMYTGELFAMDSLDRAALAEGVGCDLAALEPGWNARIRAVFSEATLAVPVGSGFQRGGRQGLHTEALGYMLAVMQVLPRSHPGATW